MYYKDDKLKGSIFIILGLILFIFGISYFFFRLIFVISGLFLINQGLRLRRLPPLNVLINYWILKFR